MKNTQLVLSVDGGGSSSQAVIYDCKGQPIEETVVGPLSCKSSTPEIVSASLLDLLSFVKKQSDYIGSCVLALSGLDSDKDYERMIGLLADVGYFSELSTPQKRLFATSIDTYWGFPLHLCSDALLPLFANEFDAGSVVIAGTGSVALNLSCNGEITRFGGWGYQVSDQGSGTWVGKKFLREALSACDTVMSLKNKKNISDNQLPEKESTLINVACQVLFDKEDPANKTDDCLQKVTAIENWSIRTSDPKVYASLARIIIDLAFMNDNPTCEAVVERAAKKLANLAYLSLKEEAPYIVLSGGLFKHDKFACAVKDKASELSAGKATIVVNTKPPALGGVEMVSYLDGK